MHLILGDNEDRCCRRVSALLAERDHQSLFVPNPVAYPIEFDWSLDNTTSASRLVLPGQPPIVDRDIEGVLVRRPGLIDPRGWEQRDLAYVHAETQAAILGWIWSLACPVVNRYPAAIWYRERAPLLAWQELLRNAGLPTLDTLITNVDHEARAFGQALARKGVDAAIYGQLTSDKRYLLSTDREWQGVASMQSLAPVCLAPPHGPSQRVCVVGRTAIWDGPSAARASLGPALVRFAKAASLSFVELVLADTSEGVAVIAVDPHPSLDAYGPSASDRIVEALVELLTHTPRVTQSVVRTTAQEVWE